MPPQAHDMNWPDSLIKPNYSNGSIGNIMPTFATMLGVPFDGLPPLRESVWQPLGDDVERVVLFIVDAFGHNLVRERADRLTPLLEKAQINDTLTSVFPSTTVNALSSIWTGTAPAQHGLVGLKIFFPELGVIGQMISLSPAFGSHPDALVAAGVHPKQFLQTPGAGKQLTDAGVQVYSAKYYGFIDSALSQMHTRGITNNIGAINMADIVVQVRELLEARVGKKMVIVCYWHTVDTLSHRYGPMSEAVAVDLESIALQIRTSLIDKLTPAGRAKTAMFITGDHGQARTPRKRAALTKQHPRLKELLMMRPSGEPRVPYLHVRHGQIDATLDYLRRTWRDDVLAIPAAQALEMGLYGPPPHAPEVIDRIGDIVVITRGDFSLLNKDDEKRPFIGRHGSLTADEMQVAWLGMRLDA